MRRYDEKLVHDMEQSCTIERLGGLDIIWKQSEDGGGSGRIDPRMLSGVERTRKMMENGLFSREKSVDHIRQMRMHMGCVNYCLNETRMETCYAKVETTCGKVPVWLYHPRDLEGPAAVLYFVHGGAFFGGSISQVEFICRLIAERANCVVCSIDYSLPPETPYPVPVTQIYEVISYFHKHAGEYRMDTNRFFVGGDSAGGNMAAAVALLDRDRATGYLKGQVLIYAKLAFSNDLPGYIREEGMERFQLCEEQKWLLPAATRIGSEEANAENEAVYIQGQYDIREPYISPVFARAKGLPDTLMIQAEFDGLRLEGEYYAKKLTEAGVKVTMISYRNVVHGFLDELGILPQSEAAVDDIVKFIQER